jgi:hypothetical protein
MVGEIEYLDVLERHFPGSSRGTLHRLTQPKDASCG